MPTEKDIDRVINGMNTAVDAADYADTIVVEVQNVSGSNYGLIWSNQYSGGFVPEAQR